MEHFPATLSRAETEALIERTEACFEEHGYGLWAVEVREGSELAGFVGLAPVDATMPFAPAVEIGWRLGRPFWGRGIAAEAARAAIDFAFGRLELSSLVSFTAERNVRSRLLMDRLGMSRDPAEDFLHPALAPGEELAPHVLYRLPAPALRP
jgi:ribosomal-protein-alanine N-acetyltransferase